MYWFFIGVVAGDDGAGPSGLCPGVGKAEGGPGIKFLELSILRQSKGIMKMKTRDVSKLSLRHRVRGSAASGANTERDNMTKLRSGRSLSAQHLEKLEVVDWFDHEKVSRARRRYSSLSFKLFWILFVSILAVATRPPQL